MQLKPIFLWGILLSISSTLPAQTIQDIWSKMGYAMASIKTATYEMSTQERIDGALFQKKTAFRLQTNPLKVYGKNQTTGVEFLYVTGWNNGKIHINPNGFPWVLLNLDPLSPQVRKNSHHTTYHAGFGYMLTMFKDVERKILAKGLKLENCISNKGTIVWNNRACYHIEIHAPSYQWITHTCTQNESLNALCDRMNILEYAVMEANKLDYAAQVTKGQQIKIPNFMAKKIVLYVDNENYLPIVQRIYDDKGLFEEYEYRNLSLKPTLQAGEWTAQCAGYGFK